MRHSPWIVAAALRSRTTSCAVAGLLSAMFSAPLVGQTVGSAQTATAAPATSSAPAAPDPGPREQRIVAGLKALAEASEKLSDWTLLILGGTFLVLLGTSYRRPTSRFVRLFYVLFPVAWLLLGVSFYEGFVLRRYHVALQLREQKAAAVNEALHGMNDAFAIQIDTFLWGLVPLAIWLLIYTVWWIGAGPKMLATSEEKSS